MGAHETGNSKKLEDPGPTIEEIKERINESMHIKELFERLKGWRVVVIVDDDGLELAPFDPDKKSNIPGIWPPGKGDDDDDDGPEEGWTEVKLDHCETMQIHGSDLSEVTVRIIAGRADFQKNGGDFNEFVGEVRLQGDIIVHGLEDGTIIHFQ